MANLYGNRGTFLNNPGDPLMGDYAQYQPSGLQSRQLNGFQSPMIPIGKQSLGAYPNIPKRNGVRQNPDGSVSTHLMATETFDGKDWFSFPRLFQNPDNTWKDMSEGNWEDAYNEANKRGEVINFANAEKAIAFGEGSWKQPQQQLPEQQLNMVITNEPNEYAPTGLNRPLNIPNNPVAFMPPNRQFSFKPSEINTDLERSKSPLIGDYSQYQPSGLDTPTVNTPVSAGMNLDNIPFKALQSKQFQIESDGDIMDRSKASLADAKQKANQWGGIDYDPNIYDVASGINLMRAASNYVQPPPPILRMKRVSPVQSKLDTAPYKQASEQVTAQGENLIETVKDNTNNASTILASGAVAGTNLANAENQISANMSQAAQGIDAQNKQSQQQAIFANAEIENQETMTNAQMQMQHEQMKKQAVDQNVNAAMVAQAQKQSFDLKSDYVNKQNEIQRRTLEYESNSKSYARKMADPNIRSKIDAEKAAADKAYNEKYGEQSAFYAAKKADTEAMINSKGIEEFSNYVPIENYNALIADAAGDEAKIEEINKQYRQYILNKKMSEDKMLHLNEYMAENYDGEAVTRKYAGEEPTLNFDDLFENKD